MQAPSAPPAASLRDGFERLRLDRIRFPLDVTVWAVGVPDGSRSFIPSMRLWTAREVSSVIRFQSRTTLKPIGSLSDNAYEKSLSG